MQTKVTTQEVNFKIFRFDIDKDKPFYYDKIKLEVTSEEVVLDILNRIKWDIDGSFSYRRSCRHGICGSCAIKINDKSTLACKERVNDLVEIFGDTLIVDPLDKEKAIKDLIIDKKEFWDKHDEVHPYLISKIIENPEREHIVTPDEAEALLEADICIQCGACHYACPVIEINSQFLGPAAFVKAYRFEADVRDEAHISRLKELHKPDKGVWDCVKCYECREVCPKDVNPIEKITKLHNMIFNSGVAKPSVASKHAVGFKHSIKRNGVLDEGGLVLYSEGLGVFKHAKTAFTMYKKGKMKMPWQISKSENLEEIKFLINDISSKKGSSCEN